MDESEPDKSKPELSDSWMVINDSSADQENHGGPSDGSDGESVEVIDQEEYEEALVERTDYETIPPGQEITGPKNKKYVHHPNNDVNAALNKLMIIVASIVIALAVGHYLGYSEEVTNVTAALRNSKAENKILKNHICKLFENYVGHNTETLHKNLKQIDKDYTLYHVILLDIKCPVIEHHTADVQAHLDKIRQAHAKGHLTDDELKVRIDKLLQKSGHNDDAINDQSSSKLFQSEGDNVILSNEIKQAHITDQLSESKHEEIDDVLLQNKVQRDVSISSHSPSKLSQSQGDHILSDEMRQTSLDDNLSDDKFQVIIAKLLQSRAQSDVGVGGLSSSTLPKSKGECVIISDEKLVDTSSAGERSEHTKKHCFDSEASGFQKSAENGHSFKLDEELLPDSTLEKVLENVSTQTDETVKTAEKTAPKKSVTYNVLTETTIDFKGTEGCPSNSKSQNLYKLERPTENLLKCIVKDMVQQMTESLLVSHHNNIMKDIRDETKTLIQSVPVFKSALLLNVEVISKLRSHVSYMKNAFRSFMDHSHSLTEQEGLTSILNDFNKHTLSLEKAMHSLQQLETTLNQKRVFTLKSQQDEACAVTEFFEKYYFNTLLISEDIKNHSFTNSEEKIGNNGNNPQKENNMVTETISSSTSNDLDYTITIDNPHNSLPEQNGGEIVQKTGCVKQEKNNAVHLEDNTNHEFPSKPTEKLPYGYQVTKEKIVTDKYASTNKHTEPKLQSNDNGNDLYSTKYSNDKHSVKYQGSKKMKGNKKENKKEKYHNKHDKKFKRDLLEIKRKHVHNSNAWVENEHEHKNRNISGEWVINLNRGRAETREAEHRSDWLFDRASARKVKRSGKWDTSDWYFERARSRNYCRQKFNKGKSKMNCPPENTEKHFSGKENKKFPKFKKYFKPKNWISKAYMAVSKFKF